MDPADRLQRDRLLRRAVLGGDERAWQTWYEESFDALYRYVFWRLAGDKDRTDEIVQETWLTAVKRLKQFDPQRGGFSVWLRGIAANVLRNHFRRQRRTDNLLKPLIGELGSNGKARPSDHNQPSPTRIAESLARLPEHYEAVLRAKYLDGLSVADIASTTEQTPKAVESLLTRARKQFRDIYENNTTDDSETDVSDLGH